MSFVKFRQRYVKFRQNAFSVCKKYTQKRDEIIQIHRKTRKKRRFHREIGRLV